MSGQRDVLARAWAEQRWLLLAFLAAVLVAAFFALRLVIFTIHWSDPARREQPPAGWMTPGYVAHSWGVDRKVVLEALGLPDPALGLEGRRATLEEIARARGVPLAQLLADLAVALAHAEAEQGR